MLCLPFSGAFYIERMEDSGSDATESVGTNRYFDVGDVSAENWSNWKILCYARCCCFAV
jgi:hypothetical protein